MLDTIEFGMTYITGYDRSQLLLLPEAVDDYVGADNPVRFIDAFVDGLDLAVAGFGRVEPKGTGHSIFARGSAKALHLRLSEPRAIKPPAGGRDPPQYRSYLAAAAPEAGLQDHR